jgi:putative membrane protein
MSEPATPPVHEDPRIRFAAERTLLAWIRTGLGMMGFGFVVARFGLFLREMEVARGIAANRPVGQSLWLGVALVVLGIVVTFLAAWQHWRTLRRLDRRQPYVAPAWSMATMVALLLSLLGVGMVFYLLGQSL